MELDEFESFVLRLQGESLTSRYIFLGDDKLLYAKVTQITSMARQLFTDYKIFLDTLEQKGLHEMYTYEVNNLCTFLYDLSRSKASIESKKREKIGVVGGFGKEKLDRIQLTTHKVLTVAFIDIDKFKRINDSYGHDIGDKVIDSVLAILTDLEKLGYSAIRNYDHGDEFLLILPEKGQDESFEIIESCRKSIEKELIEGKIKVTVSCGLATYPHDGATKEQLIKNADKAMLHSKENGGNLTTKFGYEQQFENINFRFEGIANIKKGSKVVVKIWRNHDAPKINNLEAVEIFDMDEEIIYTSGSKGVLMTVIPIEKDIRGVVIDVKRPNNQTLFALKVDKKELEWISTDPRDFLNPLVRY